MNPGVLHNKQELLLSLAKKYDLSKLSYREIGKLTGDLHPQVVKHHLEKLIQKGFLIKNRKGRLVPIDVSNDHKDLVSIPIMGSANCGTASSWADNRVEGYLKISPKLLLSKRTERLYALKAIGNSMNRANINGNMIEEGDFVLVDNEYSKPSNNDYVVSVIDNLANIKKLLVDTKKNMIMLMSESTTNYPPIFIHESEMDGYRITGKVVQVIKNLASG